jgi:hypothetical protein
LKEAHQIARARYGPDDGNTLAAATNVGLLFLRQGDYAGAEPYFQECSSSFRKRAPDSSDRFLAESRLGWCLVGLERYSDAEPLLLCAYEVMKSRERSAPPEGKAELKKVIEHLIRLYEARGKADEVRKWSTRFVDLVFLEQPFAPP